MDRDGANQRDVLPEAGFDDDPTWLPDASAILFERSGSLYRVRPDGTGLQQVTHGDPASGITFQEGVYSPDASTIAAIRVTFGNDDIVLVNPAGGDVRVIVPHAGAYGVRIDWAVRPGSTTTTTTVSTSTSTSVPPSCAPTVTFTDVACRLHTLAASVRASSGVGTLRGKLLAELENADATLQRADVTDDSRRARAWIHRAGRWLVAFGHRLRTRVAHRQVDDETRDRLVRAGRALRADLRMLAAR